MTDMIKMRMTTEEYFALPETMLPTQLIDGEFIEIPTPDIFHQFLVLNLGMMFAAIELWLGGRAYIAPVGVVLDEQTVLQPDAIYLMPDSQCKDKDGKRLIGAPELVAEVLSSSTAYQDRGKKFALYEKHGAREYWLVDPRTQIVSVWQRQEERFVHVGDFGIDNEFKSVCIVQVIVRDIFVRSFAK
jgi:Uma2 family endonuclease